MDRKTPIQSIKISGYKVTQPNSEELLIEKTWRKSFFPLLFISAFFFLWYYGLITSTEHNDTDIINRVINIISDDPLLIIFFIAPLFIMIPIFIKFGGKAIKQEKYFIDSKRGTIMKNNRMISTFADISKIYLNTQNTQLNVNLKNGDTINLIKARSRTGILKVAEIIAKFTKLPITNN